MNAVTYARYSTGRQRKASLDEQSRVPQMYRQLAFELARALKADITTAREILRQMRRPNRVCRAITTAREILRPLVEGAALIDDGQTWAANGTN